MDGRVGLVTLPPAAARSVAVCLQYFPSCFDFALGLGHVGDDHAAIEHVRFEAGPAVPAAVSVENLVDSRREDGEMGLLEAADHLAHNRARSFGRSSGFYPRAIFRVDRLPVQAARIRLPVLIADGGPDGFKGCQVGLLLFWRQLREERDSTAESAATPQARDLPPDRSPLLTLWAALF